MEFNGILVDFSFSFLFRLFSARLSKECLRRHHRREADAARAEDPAASAPRESHRHQEIH